MKVFIVLQEWDDVGFSDEVEVFLNYKDAEQFKMNVELFYVYIMHFKRAIIIEKTINQKTPSIEYTGKY
ncbi:MAG: hypothetical protein ABF257_01935 [Polaribacter sp.]